MKRLHNQNKSFTKNNNHFLKQENRSVSNYPEQVFIVRDEFDSMNEAKTACNLAIGRILQIGSRPSKHNDLEIFYNCKDIIMKAHDFLKNSAE